MYVPLILVRYQIWMLIFTFAQQYLYVNIDHGIYRFLFHYKIGEQFFNEMCNNAQLRSSRAQAWPRPAPICMSRGGGGHCFRSLTWTFFYNHSYTDPMFYLLALYFILFFVKLIEVVYLFNQTFRNLFSFDKLQNNIHFLKITFFL